MEEIIYKVPIFISTIILISYTGVETQRIFKYETIDIPRKHVVQLYRAINGKTQKLGNYLLVAFANLTIVVAVRGYAQKNLEEALVKQGIVLALFALIHLGQHLLLSPNYNKKDKSDDDISNANIEKEIKQWVTFWSVRTWTAILALLLYLLLNFADLEDLGGPTNITCAATFFSGLYYGASAYASAVDLDFWKTTARPYEAKTFKMAYDAIAKVMPGLTLTSSGFSLAYLLLGYSKFRYNHIANIVLILSALPYTIYVMQPVNKKIFATIDKEYDPKVMASLFNRWGKLSWGRPLIGFTAVSQLLVVLLMQQIGVI